MNSELERLRKEIFFGEHSDDEWKKIQSETETALENATVEDVNEFTECGAVSLLEQIIEYM